MKLAEEAVGKAKCREREVRDASTDLDLIGDAGRKIGGRWTSLFLAMATR